MEKAKKTVIIICDPKWENVKDLIRYEETHNESSDLFDVKIIETDFVTFSTAQDFYDLLYKNRDHLVLSIIGKKPGVGLLKHLITLSDTVTIDIIIEDEDKTYVKEVESVNKIGEGVSKINLVIVDPKKDVLQQVIADRKIDQTEYEKWLIESVTHIPPKLMKGLEKLSVDEIKQLMRIIAHAKTLGDIILILSEYKISIKDIDPDLLFYIENMKHTIMPNNFDEMLKNVSKSLNTNPAMLLSILSNKDKKDNPSLLPMMMMMGKHGLDKENAPALMSMMTGSTLPLMFAAMDKNDKDKKEE